MKRNVECFVLLSTILLAQSCFGSVLVKIDSFQSPVAKYAVDLDYDPVTGTLWSIDNYDPETSGLSVYNFDLTGNLISKWPTGLGWNLNTVAVDSANNRLFYYKNFSRKLFETTLSGEIIRTTVLPDWDARNALQSMAYDSQSGELIFVWHNRAGTSGFYSFDPDEQQLLELKEYIFENTIGGFDLDQEFYYLNIHSRHSVQVIDRETLQVDSTLELPSTGSGIALGEDNLLYQINFDGMVNVYQLPEPATMVMLGLGGLAIRKRRT